MTQRTVSRLVLAAVVGLIAVAGLAASMPTAAAQVPDPYSSGSPTVLPTLITRPATPDTSESPSVLPKIIHNGDGPQVGAEAEPGVLPFTGGDMVVFFVVAAALIGTGAVLVRSQRKKEERV